MAIVPMPDHWCEEILLPATCPHCGAVFDNSLNTTEHRPMDPGTLMICLACCQIAIRADGGRLEKVPEPVLLDLMLGPQGKHIGTMMDYARQVGADRRSRGVVIPRGEA